MRSSKPRPRLSLEDSPSSCSSCCPPGIGPSIAAVATLPVAVAPDEAPPPLLLRPAAAPGIAVAPLRLATEALAPAPAPAGVAVVSVVPGTPITAAASPVAAAAAAVRVVWIAGVAAAAAESFAFFLCASASLTRLLRLTPSLFEGAAQSMWNLFFLFVQDIEAKIGRAREGRREKETVVRFHHHEDGQSAVQGAGNGTWYARSPEVSMFEK